MLPMLLLEEFGIVLVFGGFTTLSIFVAAWIGNLRASSDALECESPVDGQPATSGS